MRILQSIWWISLILFLIHQVLQYGYEVQLPLFDNYLDPLLCMPLLLGLWNWERHRWWSLPPLGLVEIVLLTFLAIVIFEGAYPYWSGKFVADYWDGLAYCTGSFLFLKLNDYL